MALGAALVDRARIHRRTSAAFKVEGRTQFSTVTGPWFRCRLDLRARPQEREAGSQEPRVVERPTLMTGVRDVDGREIDLMSTDRVEVRSPELGNAFFAVTADPTPMRKKRRVIGWEVALTRVEEHQADPSNVVPGGTG